jgi:hypothetical protein
MDRWDTTPRLAFLSPEKASGKSRALEVTELLVPCPVMAVNMSPAYIFRKVGSEEGAPLLYDEIDTVFGPKAKENEEIRALLMPVIGAVLLPAVASCMGRKSEPKRSARMRPSRSPAWAGYPILSCRVR